MDPNGPAIFTIGRMNPPTSGHLRLIREMMIIALDQGQNKIYIILSHTKDNKKNPLGCSRKKEILVAEGMIEYLKQANPLLSEIEVDIRCMNETVPKKCDKHVVVLKQVCKIQIDAGNPTHMILIVGADRASSYDWIVKYLNEEKPPVILDIISLDRPEDAMSATSMRSLVLKGDKEEFIKATMTSGLPVENAVSLYAELERELKPQGKRKTLVPHSDEPPRKLKKSEHSDKPPRKRTKGGKKKRTKRRKRTDKKRKTRTYKKQKRSLYFSKHQS